VSGLRRKTITPSDRYSRPETNVIPKVSTKSPVVKRMVATVTVTVCPARFTRYVTGAPTPAS
jgi:hypothetical protein